MAVPEKADELAQLHVFATARAWLHSDEVFLETAGGHLRRVAAAGLLRLPGCLAAVRVLAAAGLALEAHTIVRTIVELAIVACWVGVDETRAQVIWDDSISSQVAGLRRIKDHGKYEGEIRSFVEELLSSHGGTKAAPSLYRMAEDAIDTERLMGKTMATRLYGWLYDPLSAAAHGELRFARLLANGLQAEFIPSARAYAAAAADFLLIATSEQLGFRTDLDKWMVERKENL